MKRAAIFLAGFVIAFHLLAFVGEALLWMNPALHGALLAKINTGITMGTTEQAVVMRVLVMNQGFYNLFLALAGVIGLICVARSRLVAGRTLIAYMCLSAVGAGIVLAATTQAYVGAFLQAVPAAIALWLTLGSRRDSSS